MAECQGRLQDGEIQVRCAPLQCTRLAVACLVGRSQPRPPSPALETVPCTGAENAVHGPPCLAFAAAQDQPGQTRPFRPEIQVGAVLFLAVIFVPDPEVPREIVQVSLGTSHHEADRNRKDLALSRRLSRTACAVPIGPARLVRPVARLGEAVALWALQPFRKPSRDEGAAVGIAGVVPPAFIDDRRKTESGHRQLSLQARFRNSLGVAQPSWWEGTVPFLKPGRDGGYSRAVGTEIHNRARTECHEGGASPQISETVIGHPRFPSVLVRAAFR